MSGDAMIRLEDVSKSFGSIQVLHDIDMEIKRGEVVVVIGPSGSGKSTLLRVMNHLEPIDRGTISLDGQPIYQYRKDGKLVTDSERTIREIRARIGMVSQRFNLFPHMNVLANVMAGPTHVRKMSRKDAEARARALLERVGLLEKTRAFPSQLSGGQQQRVAIARALAMDPEAMLFDEVTSALDPELTGEVLAVMESLAADGMTMILVTHEMAFARNVAHQVVLMHQGRIWEEGPPGRMFGDPQTPELRQFLGGGVK